MGAIAICVVFAVFVTWGMLRPSVATLGYMFFAVLVPQWNWRWSIPDFNFQKYLAASALIGFILTGMLYQKLPRWGRCALVCLVLTLALNFLSSLQSISPEKSAFFMDVFWKIVLMAVLAMGILATLKDIRLACILLVVAQGWNAFNINQLYLHSGWINLNAFSWNFLDNNTYSISSLPVMALAVGLLLADRSRWTRVLAGIVVILQLHQLMILESRGTMIGAIVMACIAIFAMPKSRVNWTVVVLGGLTTIVFAGPPVIKEFASIFVAGDDRDSSADSRLDLWDAGFRITMDYPGLGLGPWAGEAIVPSYYQGDIEVGEHKALHNLFFEMSTGAGVPALMLFVSCFLVVLRGHWQLWRSSSPLPDELIAVNIAVLSGIPGFLVASMFSSGILIESPYILLTLGIAAVAANTPTDPQFAQR